ncbi:hypothetical protein DACRYDRAFT_21671 [Dacryopinax primogenitus]|uniref:Uncharacterized protein n=1 Tax=Dacryopinax primogenitus (strain DJM 731) TaxID=1858805 RepID=M5GDR7_DACPD|nr:uncharacterized protein DACRYDRAFT_21671 [Dacryopinax primogenitus]EJU02638.1 hypothetical protein DACRYDRAFT_21671 [Dacryopinax primogenitus]
MNHENSRGFAVMNGYSGEISGIFDPYIKIADCSQLLSRTGQFYSLSGMMAD